MKIVKDSKLISFEFRDKDAAMIFAQRIADACGGTVKVVSESGEDIALAKPHHVHPRTMTIASVQALADAMDTKTKH